MIEQEKQSENINQNIGNIETPKKNKLQSLVYASLFLNLILVISVSILFMLFFKSGSNNSGSVNTPIEANKPMIAYVNTDSLMTQYEFVTSMKSDLETKQKQFENSLIARQRAFETEVADFQKKVANNLITMDQAKEMEQKLMQKQQSLLEYKENLSNEFATHELELNVALYDSIHSYLKRFNNDAKYHYILGYSRGGGILFANDSLDITGVVVKELNEQYRKTKK